MYKVVIVDDESYVLNMLAGMELWNEMGFEVSASFTNSSMVADFLENNKVDVLITDIKMPHISGLDLAKICHDKYPDIHIVIISAYHEFEYAKTAIKYGVSDFLTKPVSYSDISDTMQRISAKLKKSDSAGQIIPLSNLQNIFVQFTSGKIPSADEVISELKSLKPNLNLSSSPCTSMNLCINDFDRYIETVWKYDIPRLYRALGSVITYETEEYVSVMYSHFLRDISFIIIYKTNIFTDSSEAVATHIKEELSEILHLDVTVATGKTYSSINDMLSTSSDNIKNISKNKIITQAICYIEEHYSESITLSSVASYIHLSPEYFGTYFKQNTGENFTNFVNRYRIEKSIEFMKDERYTITAICDMVGFKNQTYFYNLFRKYYHLSPQKYRKKFFPS